MHYNLYMYNVFRINKNNEFKFKRKTRMAHGIYPSGMYSEIFLSHKGGRYATSHCTRKRNENKIYKRKAHFT